MSIYKREGSPYYQTEFQINGVRFRRSTGATTSREALAVEKRMKEEERQKLKEGKPKASLTLNECFGRYWTECCRTWSPRWQGEVKRYIREILDRVDMNMPVEEVDDAVVNDYVQIRVGEGGGEYAINRAIAVWRGMHRRSRKKWKQRVQEVDWADFMNDEEERVRWIERDEAQRLLSTIQPYVGVAVEWTLYTGCRQFETYGLTENEVYLERGYARVRPKGWKKDSDWHVVWLTPDIVDVLKRAKSFQRGRYIFDRTNRRKVWEAAVQEAGIDDFRWHDLRHTAATWLRQAGTPLEVVQRFLGHADLKTTLRYAHIADSELMNAVHNMPSLGSLSAENVVKLASVKKAGA